MSAAARARDGRRLDGVAAYFAVAAATQVGFFLGRYLIAAVLTPADFGRWDAVLGLGSMLGIVLTAGLHGAVMHYAAIHRDEPGEQRRYLSSALAMQVGLAVIAAAAGWVLLRAVGSGEVAGFDRGELAAAGAVALATAGPTVLTAALLGRRVRAPVVVANVVRLAALAVLVAALAIAAGRRDLATVAIGWSLGGAVQTATLVMASRDLLRVRSVDRATAVSSLRYGAGAFLHTAGGWMLIASDRVVLKANVSATQLGRYGLAYLIAFSYEQLFTITNQLALPRMYALLADDRPDDLVTVLRAAFVAVTVCGTVFVAAAPALLPLVAPSAFGDLSALVAVLASAVFWSGAYTVLVNILFFHRRVGVLAATTAASAVVGVAPILVLVDRYGVMSAAGATLAGYAVHFASVALVARRLFPMTPLIFPSLAGTAVTVLALSQTAAVDGAAATLAGAGAALALALLVTAEVRRVDVPTLRRVLSRPPASDQPGDAGHFVEPG